MTLTDLLGINTEKLLFIVMVILTFFVILIFVMCLSNMGKIRSMSLEEPQAPGTEELKKYLKKMILLSEEAQKAVDFVKENGGDATPQQVINKVDDENAISKYAIVHFNAFSGITGSVSFAVALLNKKNNGIILTSLYGHESCNTYIREIREGNCDVNLLEEEEQALINAINS